MLARALMQCVLIHFQLTAVAAFQRFLVRAPVGLVINYHQSAVFFKCAVNIALDNDDLIGSILGNIGIDVACTDAYGDLLLTQKKRRTFDSLSNVRAEEIFELISLKDICLILGQVMLAYHAIDLSVNIKILSRIVKELHEFMRCSTSAGRIHSALAQKLRLFGGKVFNREFARFEIGGRNLCHDTAKS